MYPCHQFCSSLMQTLSRLLVLRCRDNEYVFKSLLTVIIVYKGRQCDTTTNILDDLDLRISLKRIEIVKIRIFSL